MSKKSLIRVLRSAAIIAVAFTAIDYSAHYLLEMFGIIENVLVVLPYYYWGKFITATVYFAVLPYIAFLRKSSLAIQLWVLTGILQLRYLYSLTPASNLVIALLHYFTLLFLFRWKWLKTMAGMKSYG